MFFSKYRKKRAVKKYFYLVHQLKKRYGKDEEYTYLQVKKTAEVMKVKSLFTEYLYAMYLGSDEFSASVSSVKTYDELRIEISVLFFYGNKDFSIDDIIEFIKPVPWYGGRVDIARTGIGNIRM